jgi:hypothetical protein
MERFNWNLAGLFLLSCGTLNGCGCSSELNASTTVGGDAEHSHDGWWCVEHGVPEEVCALCDVDLVPKFKTQGDWCAEHDRPESQCFVCNPEKEQEFAAQYEAKFGTAPPTRDGNHEENEHGHDHAHEHEHEHAEST